MRRKIRGLRASAAAALALTVLTGLGSAVAETSSPAAKIFLGNRGWVSVHSVDEFTVQ